MVLNEDGLKTTVKVYNITTVTFALEVKGSCEVMLDSAAEIAATARREIAQTLHSCYLLKALRTFLFSKALRAATDAELSEVCKSLGLSMAR